jgi:FAD:protein FMN transferase
MPERRKHKGIYDPVVFPGSTSIPDAGNIFENEVPSSESVLFSKDLYKVTRLHYAMGAFIVITLIHPSQSRADEAINAAFTEIDRLIKQFDRHDPNSPVAALNREGFLSEISPEMFEVMSRAQHFFWVSGGAFDVTVKPLIDLYKKHFDNFHEPPLEVDIKKALKLVDGNLIRFDGRTIAFTKDGMGISLDGIAKGFIVDRAIDVLSDFGIKHALIDAHGDIRAIGGKNDKVPWTISIQNPDKHSPSIDTLEIRDGAVSTSASYVIHYDMERYYHHLLNPGTGHSPQQFLSVTTMADCAADADAIATALFVQDTESGQQMLEQIPGAECFFYTAEEGKIPSKGWPSA